MNKVFITDVNKFESIDCPSSERETTICMSDDYAEIYTTEGTTVTKLKKLMLENPENWECWEAGRTREGFVSGYFFKTPRKSIVFKNRKKRDLSEEQRKAIAQRFKEGRAAATAEEEDDE